MCRLPGWNAPVNLEATDQLRMQHSIAPKEQALNPHIRRHEGDPLLTI